MSDAPVGPMGTIREVAQSLGLDPTVTRYSELRHARLSVSHEDERCARTMAAFALMNGGARAEVYRTSPQGVWRVHVWASIESTG